MAQFAKKIALLGLILCVSWLGIMVGQTMTRQIAYLTVQAAPGGAKKQLPEGTPSASAEGKQERYENLELFQRVLHFVENNYVEPNTKNKDLIYGAIKGMMETLDPHSQFLTPEIFKDMKTDTSGKFGGLGIEIGMKDSILTVISPIEDTPAWKAGLKSNDRIVKINSESTKGMTLMEAVSKMRGKKGTDVVLAVYREGWDKIRDITITRDIIKIQAVKFEELETGWGYVRLASFNEAASADVKKALEKLESKGKLKGLVFDLRMNPGGLLDQAVEVASLFIDEGVVVSTIGRNPDQKEVKYARKGVARKDFPMAVLVNSSSASAAEIVAGALQDNHRAVIIGQPTFGKGSVQTVIELTPELGLKLTIARYYTPSGRSIQEKGVQPDLLVDDYDPKLLADAKRKGESFREKDLKGHMINNEEDSAGAKQAGEFKKEELEMLVKDSKKKGKHKGDDKKDAKDAKDSKDAKEEDDLAPMKFNPKEDFQVREAVNYLKSFDIFKRLNSK